MLTITPSAGYSGTFAVTASVSDGPDSATQSFQVTTQVVAPSAVLQLAGGQFAANVTDGSTQVVLTRAGNLSATVTVMVSSPGGSDVAAFQKTVTFGPNATSATVAVPIQNNGQPGEPNVSIPLSLSSPSVGATLGATVATTLVVHDNNARATEGHHGRSRRRLRPTTQWRPKFRRHVWQKGRHERTGQKPVQNRHSIGLGRGCGVREGPDPFGPNPA
ncbi:MAG: hypothetical protein ACHRXM_03590 [Isosphaerales bacterium]